MDLYLLFRLIIVALFLAVFAEASLNKIAARGMPDWFRDQFAKTWMGQFPLGLMWWIITLAELGIALTFVGALIRVEFQGGDMTLTSLGCLGAGLLFAGLCFGQRVAMDYAGSASAFVYSALSLLLFVAVQATSAL